MKEAEMDRIGRWIGEALTNCDDEGALDGIGREVVSLTRRHAFYADRLRQPA
jgi:glycine/serine hydroxymethyltransferase